MSSRLHVNALPGWSTRNNSGDRRNAGETKTFLIRQNSIATASHEQQQEDSAMSDHASLSSIEDMIESDIEIDTESQQNTSFSSAQHSTIEEIVSRSVHAALNAFSTPTSALNPLASNQTSCTLVRPLLWVFHDQLTVASRTKYSGVSTLILLCFYWTTYTSPRPLRFSSVWTTRPQAPWAPPSPLTHFRNGSTPIWSIC